MGNSGIDDLFEILKGKKVKFQKDFQNSEIEFTGEQPPVKFKLQKTSDNQYTIIPNINIFDIAIIRGKNYTYLLDKNKFYKCTKEFEKSTLKLLELFRQNYLTEVMLGKEDLSKLFSIIVPKLKKSIEIQDLSEEEIEKYKPQELVVKVYLDFEENDYLVADVKFCYGENEFNPLDEKHEVKIPRNMIQETKALNLFRKTGFMFDTKNLRFILTNNDKIYEFLSEDIAVYMQKFEVLVTEKFKTKQIREPKIGTLGIKIENNLLSIDLKDLDLDATEIEDIMQKYRLKKKYYRLSDGSFIKLEDNKEIDFLDKLVNGMDVKYEDIENGELTLPVQRSLYLDQLLKGIKGTEVIKNNEYRNMINKLDKEQAEEELQIPGNLNKVLRYYQKVAW